MAAILKTLRNCGACDKPGAVDECGGCYETRYCNAVCQKRDWKRHKSECARFADMKLTAWIANPQSPMADTVDSMLPRKPGFGVMPFVWVDLVDSEVETKAVLLDAAKVRAHFSAFSVDDPVRMLIEATLFDKRDRFNELSREHKMLHAAYQQGRLYPVTVAYKMPPGRWHEATVFVKKKK